LVAAAFAAPQYGSTPEFGSAPQAVDVSQHVSLEHWATQNLASSSASAFASAQFEPAATQWPEPAPQQQQHHFSSEPWSSPNSLSIQPARPQIEEIQRQWEQFLV
jgi:hypothetical protein